MLIQGSGERACWGSEHRAVAVKPTHLDERRDLNRGHHLVRDLRAGRSTEAEDTARAQDAS